MTFTGAVLLLMTIINIQAQYIYNVTISGGTNDASSIGGEQTNQILFWITTTAPSNAIPNEFWISPTNSFGYVLTGTVGGVGTKQNPFYGDFNRILGLVSSNSIVHLYPGTFWTPGYCEQGNSSNVVIPTGVQIIGSGEYATTVACASGVFTNLATDVFYSSNNGVVIRDLTIDCHGSSTWTNALNAIVFTQSRDCEMSHILAMNAAGNAWENFTLDMNCLYGGYNNLIEYCTVTNMLGTYCNAINWYGGGTCFGNTIYLPLSDDSLHIDGLNVGGTNANIINNYIYGGECAIYQDSWPINNLLVSQNKFIGVLEGYRIGPWGGWVVNVDINNNLLELRQPTTNTHTAFLYSGYPATNINIQIHNNTFTTFSNEPVNLNWDFAFYTGGIFTNCSFANNKIVGMSDLFKPYHYSFQGGLLPGWIFDNNIFNNVSPVPPAVFYTGVNSSLLLYLPFDEGTGTNTVDYGYQSQCNIPLNTFNPYLSTILMWATGLDGEAISCNSNNFCIIGSSSNSTLGVSISNVTVSCWLKFTSTPTTLWTILWSRVYGSAINAPNNGDLACAFNNGNIVFESHTTSGESTAYFVPSGFFQTNTWHNLVCVYDGVSNYIYLNGVLSALSSQSGMIAPQANVPWRIAYDSSGPTNFVSALVDNFKVWDRALNTNEIIKIYNER